MEGTSRKDEWKNAVALNLTMLIATLCYMAFMVKTKIYCPIRHFTGIPCAGCGMSRALVCLLHGNIEGYFRCNPALIPCVTAVFFLLNRGTVVLAKVNRKVTDAVILTGFGLTLLSYLVRLLFFEIP